MKSRKLVLFLLLTFLIGSPIWAQSNTTKAELTENGIIQLPENEPLSNSYEINISDLNFQSEAEAVAFFSNYNGDGFFMRPVFHKNIAIVYLQLKENPEWSVAEWNAHFNVAMENKVLTQKSVNHEK